MPLLINNILNEIINNNNNFNEKNLNKSKVQLK